MIPDLVNAFVWINICLYRTLYFFIVRVQEGGREGGTKVLKDQCENAVHFHIDRV